MRTSTEVGDILGYPNMFDNPEARSYQVLHLEH